MSNYVVPQALVHQEYTLLPDVLTAPLRACVIGPNYQLVVDAVNGLLGAYDSAAETCYSWPNREAGAVVDQDWTRVFIDEALLQYFHNPASTGDQITATYCQGLDLWEDATVKNAIRSTAVYWKTYLSYTRNTALKNRDVTVGDTVKVSGVVGSTLVTLWSSVIGFINEKIAGSVGTATEDPNNVSQPLDSSSSISPSMVVTKIGFPASSVDVTSAAVPPNVPEQGYIDGVQSDVYFLEVIEGGSPAEAVIQVISASGKDDVASVTPSAWGVATSFGNKNLWVTFTRVGVDEFEVGMQWELSVDFGAVDVDPVSGGTYDGPSDTTYIITVTKGGRFGSAMQNPEVTITTSTGIDSSGPHEITALSTLLDIGSYGVTLMFTSPSGIGQGLYLGDRYYIVATAAEAGAVRTLLLANNLPDSLLGVTGGVCGTPPDLSVTLYIKKDIEVEQDRTGFAPLTNFSTDATEICLADGIMSYDSTWVDDSGELLPLPVKGGDAWVYYRALRTVGANIVGSVSSVGSMATELGTVSVDNPLAYGIYMALLNAGGTAVKYISVASDDLAGYLTALGKLEQRNDVHGLCPLTFDVAIQNAVTAHATSMSTAEAGRWRRVYTSNQLVDEEAILTETEAGDAILATIKETGSTYTLVELTNMASLLTDGVRAGDIVRAQYATDGFGNVTYEEYQVDAVLSEDSLRLVTGPSVEITVASKLEIWRNMVGTELVTATTAVGARSGTIRRTNVWPDYFESAGALVPSYFLCCALAGLRSSMVPQRSMTNVEITGVDSVNRTTELFTEDELNQMAETGTLIVTQNMMGDVYIRHNLTTDMTSVKTREESSVSNLDSISYVILEQIAVYIGVSNLTQETMDQVRCELLDVIEYLRNNSTVPTVGGQLIDGTITKLERHPTMSDRLVVVLNLELPAPMNNVEVHLVV